VRRGELNKSHHADCSHPNRGLGHIDLSRIAQDLQIRKSRSKGVVQLLDEGNTIPFITRYRKERTGGLDEEVLRLIQERINQLRQLADRKQTILKSIGNQGRLTHELRSAGPRGRQPEAAGRHISAVQAEEALRGDGRPARRVWNPWHWPSGTATPAVDNLPEVLQSVTDPEKGLATAEEVLLGVQHILAELVSESADVRSLIRAVMWDTARLVTAKSEKVAEGQGLDFKDYFQFVEPVRTHPAHRVLAINRGEKEGVLTVKMEWDAQTGRRPGTRTVARAFARRNRPAAGNRLSRPPPRRRLARRPKVCRNLRRRVSHR